MAFTSRKKPVNQVENPNTVEINAEMQGTLSFNDAVNLKINGQFKGSLDTKGTLTIGSKANVEANITGENIVIAGKIHGDVIATKMLVLMPTGILRGNIQTPKLNIVEGAIFHGNCTMIEGFLDIDEVAKYLEIDLKEIESLANSGKIPARKAGDRWKFERDKIDTWAATGKIE